MRAEDSPVIIPEKNLEDSFRISGIKGGKRAKRFKLSDLGSPKSLVDLKPSISRMSPKGFVETKEHEAIKIQTSFRL